MRNDGVASRRYINPRPVRSAPFRSLKVGLGIPNRPSA